MSPRRTRSRSRNRNPKRCQREGCNAPITLLRVANGRFLPFNAVPVTVDDSGPFPVGAYPKYGLDAWSPDDLVAELQVAKSMGLETAIRHVRGLPWHTRHACNSAPAYTTERETADR